MNSHSIGKVLELFVSEKSKSERISKMVVTLDIDGVVDDKFYAKNRERSVLLATVESYNMAIRENIPMVYGMLGENILIDYNPYSLEIGTKIQIGEVLLEVSQSCTICDHLSLIDTKLPILLKENRGIFVKVVKSGSIVKGDKIYLL